MGLGKRILKGVEGWNRQRQLKQGIRKSFYAQAKQGMELARQHNVRGENNWFAKMQRREGRQAKRRVFWREDAGKLLGGLNSDAQNLIGKPLRKTIRRKMRIGKHKRKHRHGKYKEPSLI